MISLGVGINNWQYVGAFIDELKKYLTKYNFIEPIILLII